MYMHDICLTSMKVITALIFILYMYAWKERKIKFVAICSVHTYRVKKCTNACVCEIKRVCNLHLLIPVPVMVLKKKKKLFRFGRGTLFY